MTATEQAYARIAVTAAGRRLELHRGVMREKPAMSVGHNWVQRRLARALILQLEPAEFQVSVGASRVRCKEGTYYIPDLFVIPVDYTEAYRDRWDALEVYADPLPLVVEIWSPSTGDYDIDEKLPEYQRRGDTEIWRLHPFDRTLTAWQRQPDGSYTMTTYTGGSVQPVALPGVTIDLDALFL